MTFPPRPSGVLDSIVTFESASTVSLDRFKTAQAHPNSGFATALVELQAGRKTSHWIWYIFPQLASLGRSSTARFYGLSDLDEACDYLRDPLLRQRLVLAAETVEWQLQHGVPLRELMGSDTDCFKLMSSLTLFNLAAKKLREMSPDDIAESDFEKLIGSCTRVVTAAGPQGFPYCSHTLQAFGRADWQ